MLAPSPSRILHGATMVALLVVCPHLAGANRARLIQSSVNDTIRDFVMQPQVNGSLMEGMSEQMSNASLRHSRHRMQPLFASVTDEEWPEADAHEAPPDVPEDTPVSVRATTRGCACKHGWTLAGNERCRDYCCNPDDDAGGEWCFVDDELCQEAGWGHCAPEGTEIEHGYRPGFPDMVAAHSEPGVSRVLAALGGGTGVRVGGLRHNELDRELLRRMRIQDKAVALAIVALYFAFLTFGFSAKYHDSHNESPVTYYADPRYHSLVAEGHDPDSFLDAFNQAPKNVHLQVTGFLPVAEGSRNSVQWRGEHYRIAFTFALDLSPWVTRASDRPDPANSADPRLPAQPLREGVVPEDYALLSDFLDQDKNELAMIQVQKEVE